MIESPMDAATFAPHEDQTRDAPLVDRLSRLRSGRSDRFLAEMLMIMGTLAQADHGFLLRDAQRRPDTAPRGRWTTLAIWTASGVSSRQTVPDGAEALCTDALSAGVAAGTAGPNRTTRLIAVRLIGLDEVAGAEEHSDTSPVNRLVALFLCTKPRPSIAGETYQTDLLRMAADLPVSRDLAGRVTELRQRAEAYARTLALIAQLEGETRSLRAALTVCAHFQQTHGCRQAAIGWERGRLIRVTAIGGQERFKRTTRAVQALEAAMEECFDQEEEILWPPLTSQAAPTAGSALHDGTASEPGSGPVSRDHRDYARLQTVDAVVSIPLQLPAASDTTRRNTSEPGAATPSHPVGVLTLERDGAPFSTREVLELRLVAEVVTRRLVELRRRDRWIGAKLGTVLFGAARWLFGPRQTGTKLTALATTALLAWLVLGTWDYRVEADFTLVTDDVVHLTAPFDGYIETADMRPGDIVATGEVLLTLDTRALHLEEAGAVARLTRFALEAEKAEARGQLADMRIFRAQQAEIGAELRATRAKLDTAAVRAPFDGVVVEGEQRQRLGAPVRRGETLYKVASIETVHAEILIPEDTIGLVAPDARGTVAFRSRPDDGFPIVLQTILPTADTGRTGNVFRARARFTEPPAPWWRPGMEGVARLDAGTHSVFWVLTHRTLSALRLLLWI